MGERCLPQLVLFLLHRPPLSLSLSALWNSQEEHGESAKNIGVERNKDRADSGSKQTDWEKHKRSEKTDGNKRESVAQD